MAKKNDAKPAFPGFVFHDQFNDFHGRYEPMVFATGGMTLRQWYAGMALQGILSNSKTIEGIRAMTREGPGLGKLIAHMAFECADDAIDAENEEEKE